MGKTKRLFFIAFLLMVGFVLPCGAQVADTTAQRDSVARRDTTTTDTLAGNEVQKVTNGDTVSAKPVPFAPNPKKAGLYSALLPGMGQLYNKDYLKIPLIYVGIGVAGYFIGHNLSQYLSYRQAYIGRINNPAPTDKYVGIYDTSQLKQLQNDYSKYLDLTVMITVIGYGVQVLDAVTAAHLKRFDISRDISMKMHPIILPNFGGLTLTFNYRYSRKEVPDHPIPWEPPGGD